MDPSENSSDLYINGKKINISLDRLIAILESVRKNLPKALESVEQGEEESEMDNLLNELNNL
ncbi:MAG: hypothetical protein O3B47_04990 [bacterium]|nr:hypothetical protein [bacterium]